MEFLNSIQGQVIAWIVAGILFWLGKRISRVKIEPWLEAVMAAIIVSGLASVWIQASVDAKLKQLSQWGGNKDTSAPAICPDGMYVVGLEKKRYSGGSRGVFADAKPICRPLNLK